jgi:hypothetical protein
MKNKYYFDLFILILHALNGVLNKILFYHFSYENDISIHLEKISKYYLL